MRLQFINNAIVKEYAYISSGRVIEDAQVYGSAHIVSQGQPFATVAGSGQVFQNAVVNTNGFVDGRGMAYGDSVIKGTVTNLGQVYGDLCPLM